ncbi:MAG: hypothetical protein JNM77_08810 [Pseudonocardia sp.]|nr:hypothetical protein [Pseudonocardia sp.]
MTHVLTALQALGVLAVLVGVALLLPPGGALVVDGALALTAATAAEAIVRKRPGAPSDRRSGVGTAGVE